VTVPAVTPRFAPGALVRARGREWVVLPGSDEALLVLRPLGGSDDEETGLDLAFEGHDVAPARFAPPTTADLGDHASARLLHQALRLSVRDGAGPFRSFARIAVEPRPYQLVPLLMALRQETIRLLIADDVGIGKTVEALLVARELLDRGEIERLAVLVPPHLAEQWQAEMREKFHVDPALVLPSTAARLERGLRLGESLFERHPFVVVSLDFIKSDRHRLEFLRTAPELVIVDEAHTCVEAGGAGGGRHQRADLVRRLAGDAKRHLLLVTATPHSGNEAAFRDLLGYLDPTFADLPEDLSGTANEPARRRLARHLVQRRRADITTFLAEETPFPERLARDETYALTKPYEAFIDRVIAYAREVVRDPAVGNERRQRVRWWSALALLRSIGSSPAAAAATLRERSRTAEASSGDEADEIGRRSVLDLDDESNEGADVAPGADPTAADEAPVESTSRRLRDMARAAEALAGRDDAKLAKGTAIVEELLAGGSSPIVFCRFIATAEYVGEALRKALPADVTVEVVTGTLAADDRAARVEALRAHPRRVLVATDCLSEGINLQEAFDAVVHYDLSWNPTRHEQREGRVDRYGQRRPQVKVVTLYGSNNAIDGIVLSVLLRKHKAIRDSLGISVPVPVNSNAVLEAILEGILLRGGSDERSVDQLTFWEREVIDPQRRELYGAWERAAERERRSRSLFAQHAYPLEEVVRARDAARVAVGAGIEVRRFAIDALRAHGATVTERPDGAVEVDAHEVPRAVRDAAAIEAARFRVRFEPPAGEDALVGRTHPLVDGLATHLIDTALDPLAPSVARRAGVIRTSGVAARTTALVVRLRFDLRTRTRRAERTSLAEEVRVLAFAGSPDDPTWLADAAADRLLDLAPSGNVLPEQARDALERVLAGIDALRPAIERVAAARAADLAAEHERVRDVADLRGRTAVTPQLPVDILGVYVFLPAPVA
jgi:superfamily II DNA or RNA helicase